MNLDRQDNQLILVQIDKLAIVDNLLLLATTLEHLKLE